MKSGRLLESLWRTAIAATAVACLIGAAAGPARAADGGAADASVTGPMDPLRLVVSLSEQRVDVYRGTTLIDSAPVSTGTKSHPTPAGVYSILQKRRWHRSNIYSGAPMPFMQRITWSGMALHAGHLPGYPASHGCIRLPPAFAEKLFSMTDVGVDVIVTPGPAKPEPIEHAALFQPVQPRLYSEARLEQAKFTPGAEIEPEFLLADLEADVDRMLAYEERSQSPLRILVTRRTGRERMMDVQRMLAELGYDPGEIDGYQGKNTGAAIQAFQTARGEPATGMVTEELIDALYGAVEREEVTGHLYVRQDYVDLFDAAVPIAEPDKPLGTHVYSVQGFAEGAGAARWTALSFGLEGSPTSTEALDRVAMPDDIRARISELLTPGSSLVISDAGLGRETGKGTDFIVQPR